MALTAALESVQSLEDNLRLSADYYVAIAQAARKLQRMLNTAKVQIKGNF